MLRRVLFLMFLALTACEGCPPMGPTPDPVQPRPTPIPTDTEWCDLAENKLTELNCIESQPTKKGVHFGALCKELQSKGIFVNPKCLAEIKTCAEVDVCTGTVNPPKANP
jgi:hypothetical protein